MLSRHISKNANCCFFLTKSACASLATAVLFMQSNRALHYEFRDGLPTLPPTECYMGQQIMKETLC